MAMQFVRGWNSFFKIEKLCDLLLNSQFVCHRRGYRKEFYRHPIRVHNPKHLEEGPSLNDYIKKNVGTLQKGADLAQGWKYRMEEDVDKRKFNLQAPTTPPHRRKDLRNGPVITEHRDVQEDFSEEDDEELKQLLQKVNFAYWEKATVEIRNLLMNSKGKTSREQHNLILLEGKRLVWEALESNVPVRALFFSRFKDLLGIHPGHWSLDRRLIALNGLTLCKAPYKVLKLWSSLTTSPGVIGVFELPNTTLEHEKSRDVIPITLICDEIREPGNLGSILRTAASVGAEKLVLIKGCCDVWESKVLRSGCGAHFKSCIITDVTWDLVSNHIPEDSTPIIADVCHPADLSLDAINSSASESRNFERKLSHAEKYDEGAFFEVDEAGRMVRVEPSYLDPQHLLKYADVQVPLVQYDSLTNTFDTAVSGGIVLIIGGETGLSLSARKFVKDNRGIQVTIPLSNRMESLNTSVAAGIILFALRQLVTRSVMKNSSVSKVE